MKKTFQMSVLVLVAGLIMVSCKKENKAVPITPPDARTTLLTKAVWKKTNEGTDTNRDGTIDIVSPHFLLSCNADDMASFQPSGVLQWLEGPTKCNADGPDTYTLQWKFVGTDGIDMLDEHMTILKLTEDALVVYYPQTTGGSAVWEMIQFSH